MAVYNFYVFFLFPAIVVRNEDKESLDSTHMDESVQIESCCGYLIPL